MKVYYNEIEPFAVEWLKQLMAADVIPRGEIDTRSIVDVSPRDVSRFDQCHFFAGVGGWPYALRLAGCSGPAWTGSCPCQPFSNAGKQFGTDDPRHLWPEFHKLIAECEPAIVFGEQVASKAGRVWLSGVRADLEALGYGVGAADLCAAGIGAPHIRQRLFWLADSHSQRHDREHSLLRSEAGGRHQGNIPEAAGRGATSGLADSQHAERRALSANRQDVIDRNDDGRAQAHSKSGACSEVRRMGDSASSGRREEYSVAGGRDARDSAQGSTERSGAGFWAAAEWLQCLDGKARRVEPGIFPLAHGVSARVGRLRGYGNAIVPQVAAEFVMAYRDAVFDMDDTKRRDTHPGSVRS